jgi:hypothetical protein
LDLGDLNPALVMDESEEVLWVKEEDEVVPSRPEDDSPVLKDRLLEQALANAAATQAANQASQPQWPTAPPPSALGGEAGHGMTRQVRPSAPPPMPAQQPQPKLPKRRYQLKIHRLQHLHRPQRPKRRRPRRRLSPKSDLTSTIAVPASFLLRREHNSRTSNDEPLSY